MRQTAERLSETIQSLSTAQLAEVERFVESLQGWERDRQMTRTLALSSQPAFEAIWNNPEDDAYDAI